MIIKLVVNQTMEHILEKTYTLVAWECKSMKSTITHSLVDTKVMSV